MPSRLGRADAVDRDACASLFMTWSSLPSPWVGAGEEGDRIERRAGCAGLGRRGGGAGGERQQHRPARRRSHQSPRAMSITKR